MFSCIILGFLKIEKMKKQKQNAYFSANPFLPNRQVFFAKSPEKGSYTKEANEAKDVLRKNLSQSTNISRMRLIEDTNSSTQAIKGDLLGSIKQLAENTFHSPNQETIKNLATKDLQLAAIEHFTKQGITPKAAQKIMQNVSGLSLVNGVVSAENSEGTVLFSFRAKSSLRQKFEAAANQSQQNHENTRSTLRGEVSKQKPETTRKSISGIQVINDRVTSINNKGEIVFKLKGRDRALQIQQILKAEIGTKGTLIARNGHEYPVIWMQTPSYPEGTFVHYRTRNRRNPRRIRVYNGQKFRYNGTENLRTLDRQQSALRQPSKAPSNFIESVEVKDNSPAFRLILKKYNEHKIYKQYGIENPYSKNSTRSEKRTFWKYAIHFLRQNELIPTGRINKQQLRKALRSSLNGRLIYIVNAPAGTKQLSSAENLRKARSTREKNDNQKFAESLKSADVVKKMLKQKFKISRAARKFATGQDRFNRAWDQNVFDNLDEFKSIIQKYPFNVRNENSVRDTLFSLFSGYGVASNNQTNISRILDHSTFKSQTGGSEHLMNKYQEVSNRIKKAGKNPKKSDIAEMKQLVLTLRNARRLAKSLSQIRYNPNKFKPETLSERNQIHLNKTRRYKGDIKNLQFYTAEKLRLGKDKNLQIALSNESVNKFFDQKLFAGGVNWTDDKILYPIIKHMGLPYLMRSGYLQKKEGKLILAKLPPIKGEFAKKLATIKNNNELYNTKWENIRADFDQSTQYKRYLGKIFDKNHLGDKIHRNVWQSISDFFAGKDARTYTMADTGTKARTSSAAVDKAYFKKILRRVQGVTSLRSAYLDILGKCREIDSQGAERINPKKLRQEINRYIELAITTLPPNHKLLKIFLTGPATPRNIAQAKKSMILAYTLRRSLSDFAKEDTLQIQRELMLIGYSYNKSVDAAKDSLNFSNNKATKRIQQSLIKQGYPPLALNEIEARVEDNARLTITSKGTAENRINLGFGFELVIPKTDFTKDKTFDIQIHKDGAYRGTVDRVSNRQIKTSVNALSKSKKYKNETYTYNILTNSIEAKPNNPRLKEAHLKLAYLKNPAAKKAFDLMTKQGRPLSEITSVVEALSGLNNIRANINPQTGKVEIAGQAGADIKLPHGFYLKPQVHIGGAQIGAGKSTDLYKDKNVRITWGLYAQGGTDMGTPAGHVGTVLEFAWKNQEWDQSVRVVPFEFDFRTMAVRFGVSYAQQINRERNKQKLHKEALKKAGWDKIQNANSPEERAELMRKDPRLGKLSKLLQKSPYNLSDEQLSRFFLNTISKELAEQKDIDFWSKTRIAGFGVGIGGQISPLTGASVFIGAFIKINIGTGPNARTIILRTSTPDTKQKTRISNQKFQNILSREFAGENITYTDGTWESSNTLINTMSRIGGQIEHSKDISFSSLYSLKKINERLAASNSAIRLEYDKTAPGLLKIVPYGIESTDLKIYLDPALRKNGLVLKNNQAYLAANRAQNIMFLERTIKYPFQKENALREKVIVITDNPHRFIDSQLDSGAYLFKKASTIKNGSTESYKFLIQRKTANGSAQNNITTHKEFSKNRSRFNSWKQIDTNRERQAHKEKKDILGINASESIRRRNEISSVAKNFFFDKKFEKYRGRYLYLSTIGSGQNFNRPKALLMRLLSHVAKKAGISNLNRNELAYLETRMAAESFTNLKPGTRWISYLIRHADATGKLDEKAKKYQRYFNRYVKTSYLKLRRAYPNLKGHALAKRIASGVEKGLQRSKFEANLRAIRNQMVRTFSTEIKRFNKNVPSRAKISHSAKQIADYLYQRMRQTDFNNPRIDERIHSKDGYIVAPFTIGTVKGKRIAGVRGLGYVHQDDVYKMLNTWRFNPKDRGIRGSIGKLVLEKLSPSPQFLADKEMLNSPLAKKIFGLKQFRQMFGARNDETLKKIYKEFKNYKKIPTDEISNETLGKFRQLLTQIRRAQLRRGRAKGINKIKLPNGFELAIAKFDIGVGTYERCGNTSPFVGEKFYIRRRTGYRAAVHTDSAHVTPHQSSGSTQVDLGIGVGINLKRKPKKPPTIPPKEPQKGPTTTPGSNPKTKPTTPQQKQQEHDKNNSSY